MKRLLLLVGIVSLFATEVLAVDGYPILTDEVDGLPWNYQVVDDEAVVVKQDASCFDAVSELVIPGKLGGRDVRIIDDYAFCPNEKLTSVVIPSSVRYIGYAAFWSCVNLQEVTITSSDLEVGMDAFYNDTKLSKLVIQSVEQWSTVTDYFGVVRHCGGNVYIGDDKIESLDIPEGVTTIGAHVFSGMTLKYISFPSTIESVNYEAFYSTTFEEVRTASSKKKLADLLSAHKGKIKSVIVEEGVETLPVNFANGISALQSISLPSTLKNISDNAFYGCTGLTTITIPTSVQTIGNYAFKNCSKLENVIFEGDKPSCQQDIFSSASKALVVTVPTDASGWGEVKQGSWDQVTKLPCVTHTSGTPKYKAGNSSQPSGFYTYCSKCGELISFRPGIQSSGSINANGKTWSYEPTDDNYVRICGVTPEGGDLHIPATVNGVQVKEIRNISENYTHYDNVYIPEGVVKVCESAFYSSAIKSVSLPSTLEVIENWAFCGTDLTEVTIPKSVTSIGLAAFGSSNLADFNVESDNPVYFSSKGAIYKRNPQTIIAGPDYGHLEIIDGTEAIANQIFYYSYLVSISIPGSVKSFDNGAFVQTSRLSIVEFRNGVISFPLNVLSYSSLEWDGSGVKIYYLQAIKICSSVSGITSDMSVLTNIKHVYYDAGDKERVKAMVEKAGLNTANVVFIEDCNYDVEVPQDWIAAYPNFRKMYCYDVTTSLAMPTGKKSAGGNEMTVWDDYVTGCDPTDPNSQFKVNVEMVDGKPVISYEPNLGEERSYTTLGSNDLKTWSRIEGDAADYKFFKVDVEIRSGE